MAETKRVSSDFLAIPAHLRRYLPSLHLCLNNKDCFLTAESAGA
jgi:hypothetical protein